MVESQRWEKKSAREGEKDEGKRERVEGGEGGGCSRMTIDPRIPTMPGRGTLGFHRPGRRCLHQAGGGGGGRVSPRLAAGAFCERRQACLAHADEALALSIMVYEKRTAGDGPQASRKQPASHAAQ